MTGHTFVLEQKPADLQSVADRLRNPSITFAGNSPQAVFGCVVALTEPEREALLLLIQSRGDVARLRNALEDIDALAVSHARGGLGLAQKIAREALK